MFAYFGTDVDRGECAVGVDVDRVVGVSVEGSDKKWGCGSVKVLGTRNMVEELAVDEFLRQEPDVMSLLVMDHVLIRVVVGREARQGSKEVLEWANINCGIKYQERLSSG